MGLSRNETLFIPFGELLDLIAIEEIKNGNSKLIEYADEPFPDAI